MCHHTWIGPFPSSPTGIKTKVVDVTKRDQVEALAKEHDHVDVLFNVAGYVFIPFHTFNVMLMLP